MPLSKKGRKIMKAMRKQYGTKRGEQVFYASKNKGTIEDVEENKKMSYLDKVIGRVEEGKAPAKVVNPQDEKDRYVSGGRTGQATGTKRLMKSGTKKASASAAERVKTHTAGPKGKLPEAVAYAIQRWATHLAEAGRELGPIAKKYEGQRASDVKDPKVKRDVEGENKRASKKLGVKVNMDAGQAIQQRKAAGRHRSSGSAAGTSTEPKDIAKADAAEDKKKMAGDK